MKKRAAVVGGSISGLLAASRLWARGWDVQVFERRPDLRSRGAGLMLDPAVARTLGGLVSRAYTERVMIGVDERVLWRQPIQKAATAWSELHRCLLAHLPDGALRFGVTVQGATVDGDVVLGDGRRERFDLVVGADGLESTVRAALDPSFAPAYFGYVAVRGVLPLTDFPRAATALGEVSLRGGLVTLLGEGTHAVGYAPPGGAHGELTFGWLWYRNTPASDLDGLFGGPGRMSLPPGRMSAALRAALLAEASSCLPGSFTALMDATPTFFLQGIYRGLSRRFAAGRLALVGDAAHVPIPHIGAGATLAWHDVETLLAAVEGDLDAWSRQRVEETRADLEVAVRFGRSLQHQRHDWATWDDARFEAWWEDVARGRRLYFDRSPTRRAHP